MPNDGRATHGHLWGANLGVGGHIERRFIFAGMARSYNPSIGGGPFADSGVASVMVFATIDETINVVGFHCMQLNAAYRLTGQPAHGYGGSTAPDPPSATALRTD